MDKKSRHHCSMHLPCTAATPLGIVCADVEDWINPQFDLTCAACTAVKKLASSPAQVLVGGLLVAGHGVHELQARALVRARQQRAAVAVDAAHALQRREEALLDLRALRQHRPCTASSGRDCWDGLHLGTLTSGQLKGDNTCRLETQRSLC